MKPKIGLVYLNRKAEGHDPVDRFICSYNAFDPGVEHDFITIYKGFSDSEIDIAKLIFQNIEDRHITVNDEMTDIDSYLIATESFPDIEIFCFLNTFSEIRTNGWLSFLFKAISIRDVGIAGATGSYESILTSNLLNSKVIWLTSNFFLRYDKLIHHQYKNIIEKHVPHWTRKHPISWILSSLKNHAVDHRKVKKHDPPFDIFWKTLTAHDGCFSFLNDAPVFPNPHIRSNAFMVRREHLSPFLARSGIMSKNDSYLFESGKKGLTNQIRRQGLRAVILNSSGDMFDIADWPKSQTFRLGKQEGLLIHDNQTRKFDELSPEERDVLSYMTWGNSLESSSKNIFTFGISFDVEI